MTSSNPEEDLSIQSFSKDMKELLGRQNLTKKWLVTIGVLVAYSILMVIPLVGADLGEGDMFEIIRTITASKQGTLAELGILPVLTAGLLMYLSLKINLYKLNIESEKERNRYNSVRIILSILMTIGMAFLIVVSGFYGADLNILTQVFIILQLTIAGVLISVLIELINRGWGLGSGISLFLIVGISIRLTQGFIAPNNILEGPNDVTSARGIMLAFFYWVGEEGPISAFGNLFFRYSTDPSHNLNLPALSIFSVYLAGVFFILATILGTRNSRVNNQDLSESTKKYHFTPIIPIVMATTILALVRFTSLLVWNASGRENSTSFPSNFLGQYSLDPFLEQYVPIGGLSYFFSAPPAFMDTLLHDPVSTIFHGIIFGAIFLGLYISMTKLMFQIGGRITNTPQEQNIDERWLYIGILCVIADLLNVLAVGLGIILLALILANYYQLITSGRSLEFVRFDLEGPEKKELGIKDRIQLTKGKYTLVVILIGLGIFLLRFIAFVILGREI